MTTGQILAAFAALIVADFALAIFYYFRERVPPCYCKGTGCVHCNYGRLS